MAKFYKLLFFNSLMVSSLITISSYSWFMMWFGMEINLLSLIPLILKINSPYSSESSLKYFTVQALASTIFIFSMVMMESEFNLSFLEFENPLILAIHTALFMKLGMAPFHSWFPEVVEGLEWSKCFIILTWQKIAPMTVLMMCLFDSKLSLIVIVSSSMIGGILGINQNSLRKILAYSSINHMSWMLISMTFSTSIWLIYFVIYSITNFNLIWLMSKFNMSSINQLEMSKIPNSMKILISWNFLSLSGLPPFIGFFPKWLVTSWLVESENLVITTILILSTIFSIFFYIRLTLPVALIKISKLNPKIVPFSKISQAFIAWNFIFVLALPLTNILF